MSDSRSNIVLVGMPGAGKSTIGVLLAKRLAYAFIDTDLLIQCREERSLQEIMDAEGYEELRQIEGEVLSEIQADRSVIATGGSAVYSDEAMNALRKQGQIVYLKVRLDTVRNRVLNAEVRGIARPADQSFEQMFEERCALYEMYAEVTVAADEGTPEEIVERIVDAVAGQ